MLSSKILKRGIFRNYLRRIPYSQYLISHQTFGYGLMRSFKSGETPQFPFIVLCRTLHKKKLMGVIV